MAEPKYDVIAIGNAIVDVIAPVTDDFLEAEDLPKGTMRLIDAERSVDLYGKMGQTKEISGGAAANTLAGATMLGLKTAFIGQVADDQLGTDGIAVNTFFRVADEFDLDPIVGLFVRYIIAKEASLRVESADRHVEIAIAVVVE